MGATRHSHYTRMLSEAHIRRTLRGNGFVAGLSQSVNGEGIVGGGWGEEKVSLVAGEAEAGRKGGCQLSISRSGKRLTYPSYPCTINEPFSVGPVSPRVTGGWGMPLRRVTNNKAQTLTPPWPLSPNFRACVRHTGGNADSPD